TGTIMRSMPRTGAARWNCAGSAAGATASRTIGPGDQWAPHPQRAIGSRWLSPVFFCSRPPRSIGRDGDLKAFSNDLRPVLPTVMRGLDPRIHVFGATTKTWMGGGGPGGARGTTSAHAVHSGAR